MTPYLVEFSPRARDDLASLDQSVARGIFAKVSWIAENFDSIKPEPLTGPLKGFFKLRIGDYRIIYEVRRSEHLLRVYRVRHRSEAYKQP